MDGLDEPDPNPQGDGMIDLRRRGFLFGAAAATLIVPARKFYLLPTVREVELVEGYDEMWGFHWARRTVDVAGDEWHALTKVGDFISGPSPDAARWAREKVMSLQPPQPAWKMP